MFKGLLTDGVSPDASRIDADISSKSFMVSSGSGMTVIVNKGFAICGGCLKYLEADETLTLLASHLSLPRIDSVVLRLNDNDSERSCELLVLTGTPATNPVRPNLTRGGSIYDIAFADIYIPAKSTVISNEYITDTRLDATRCGLINAIDSIDTTQFTRQLQSELNKFINSYESGFNNWSDEQRSDFETWSNTQKTDFMIWFNSLQEVLDKNVATNLQNQINATNNRIKYHEQGGYLGGNLIPYPYYYNSRTINGVTFTVKDGKVIANGTATATIYFVLAHRTRGIKLKNNTYYRVSGCPSGNNNKISISAGTKMNSSGSYIESAYDYGEGAILNITKDYDGIEVLIVIASGYTVNNVEFKPMLVEVNSDGTYPTEYMPYSKSNLRLTNELDSIFDNGYASRNLIPFPYYNKSGSINRGITYTYSDDGIIYANGTADVNSQSFFVLRNSSEKFILKADKKYVLINNSDSNNSFGVIYFYDDSGLQNVEVTTTNAIGQTETSTRQFINTIVGTIPYNLVEFVVKKDCYANIQTRFLANGATISKKYVKVMLVEVNADGTYPTEYQKYIPSNEVLNEKIGKVLTSETINMSDISYTFTDSAIKTDSMIDIYDTIYGFNPKEVTVTNGTCTIVFEPQETAHQIKIKVQ